MKKCCAMVLAAVLCIGLLAGCGDQAKGGAADQVTAASVGFDVEAYQKAKDEAVRLVNDSTAKYNSHPTIFSSSYDFSEHDPKKRNTYVYFSTDKGSVSVVIRNQSLKLTSVDVNSKEKDKAYLEEMFTHWSKVLGIKTTGSFDDLAQKSYFDASGCTISIKLDLGYFSIRVN